jgi:hypothetical protein
MNSNDSNDITDAAIVAAIEAALPHVAPARLSYTRETCHEDAPWQAQGYAFDRGVVMVDGYRAGAWWDNRRSPLSASLRPCPDVMIDAIAAPWLD